VLLVATEADHAEITKLLLEKGAEVNLQDTYGLTALAFASQMGRTEIVRLLLGKGADPNLKSNEVKTAYDYALNRDIKAILTAYIKKE
jgi:ankyrin repeat protein